MAARCGAPNGRVCRFHGELACLHVGSLATVDFLPTLGAELPTRLCWTLSMIIDPQALRADFAAAASRAHVEGWPCEIQIERLLAPHTRPPLPPGFGAVYVFALAGEYGAGTPAGAARVLKVGRVSPSNGARFTYMHYGNAAGSTLAKSLVRYKIMWPWLGIDTLDNSSVKHWMLTHLDRFHFYVPAGRDAVLASLEVYVRARLGSVFEGAA